MGTMGANLSDLPQNPAWTLVNPFFDVIAIAVFAWMAFLVIKNYFKGEHHKIVIEVLFGIIALVFLVDPTLFFGVLGWITNPTRLPHK